MSSPADHPARDAGRDSTVAARVEQLYERHASLVRSVCRSLLRDRVEAEDAAQQTFLSAHRALLNGSAPRDGAAWLATIARHESLARVRARMRDPLPAETEDHAAGPDAHAAAVRSQEAGELRDALAGLPAQQREAILLREVRGFSYQEVARALSVTTPAVESLLFRARRTLQARLREALAALSPAEWVQPLRELAARLAGGGLAGPAAAKVAALGVGTAVVTGGALSGPTVLGLGHAPAPAVKAVHPATHRPSHVVAPRLSASPPLVFAAPPVHEVADHRPRRASQAGGDGSGSRVEGSDGHERASATETERSADTSRTPSTVRTSSSSTQEADGGTTQRLRASSTGDSPTSTTGDSGAGGSGDAQTRTADSGSGSTTAGSGIVDD